MAVDISLEVAGSEDGSTLTGPCAGPNGSVANETMVSLGFIYSPYAHGISGVFVWSALLLTCFQIFQHLRYYTVPEQQLWIVRILFIVPIYGFCSWLGLLLPSYAVYFDAVRSCYEAFVIYNFLRLCLAYLGGETAILADINGKQLERSCLTGTCCFPQMSYSIRFLRFCKQATLQFCIVKPLVGAATIILEATGVYHAGSMSPTSGYLYCTIVYNVSVSLAIYGLVLFYSSTRHLLSPYYPILKFLAIKSIVFLSFWQGLMLTTLHWATSAFDATTSSAYQNFLITIEMFLAAILLRFAFPYKMYMDLRKDKEGRGVPVKAMTTNFTTTLNPHDVVDDAIHNFSRVYQQYAQQADMSEGEEDETKFGLANGSGKIIVSGGSGSDESVRSPKRRLLKGGIGRGKAKGGFERVTLLVESDEDEVL